MEVNTDFAAYQQKVLDSLVKVTKTSSHLATQDLGFHRSSSDKVSKSIEQQGRHLLELTSKLLKAAAKDTNKQVPALRTLHNIEDNWPKVVDVVDDQFEKADASLDEYTGVIKRMSPAVQDSPQPTPKTVMAPKAFHRFPKVVDKPQQHFNRQVNNFDTKPFKPLLSYKPHAIVPLEESIGDGSDGYNHPYAHEIDQYTYPPALYESTPPIPFTPPEDNAATFVDTEDAMLQMLIELKRAKEIAVDLEHHDYRSYVGMVCLMQISTRDKDWIVDTLKPWREKLQILNEVFANPKILKVFHGSSMDMIWLQRDLGLYVVGLFDTYYASDALNLPGKGLKYLLERFANFEAQKQFQLSDWRTRPLPVELINYARSDTHYLLNVYDQLRNMLIENSTPDNNLIDYVLENSKKEALQTYQRFVYNAESGRGSHGWFALFTERSNNYTSEQFAVFRAIHAWRDRKARELDESPVYLIPNKALWILSEFKPTNQTELYRFCRPVPSIVTDNFTEFKDVVFEAKRESKDDPLVHETIKQNEEKYGVLRNRWRKPREPSKTQQAGVGATLNHLKLNGDVADAQGQISTVTLADASSPPAVERAEQSMLWGGIPSIPVTSAEVEFALSFLAMNTMLPLQTTAEGAAPTTSQPSMPEAAAPELMEEVKSTITTAAAKSTGGSVFAFIDNVNDGVDGHLLRAALENYGELRHFHLARPAACAFAEFTTPEGFAAAVAANPHIVGTTMLTVEESRPDGGAYGSAASSNTGGRKRKVSESIDVDATDDIAFANGDISPTQSINPEYEARRLEKKKRKEERRASKQAKRADDAQTSTVPYDYAAQPSFLTPPQQNPSTNSGSGTVPMNPYAKAMDTSTGARQNKMGKELKGKSMTFKS